MLPTGTVTLLFTDIEGSTHMLRAIGVERYDNALKRHRLLLREAYGRHAGHEVSSDGDSVFVAFGRALDAARAALEMQCALAGYAWADGERIRVRIGLHTCEATVTGSNYVGIGVHRAARISATGHGDQIVLSQTTRDLIEDEAGITCRDLGLHPLKDFAQPQRLYQLVDARLPEVFPPLRTSQHRPTNLTAPATPLVGREMELASIRALVRRPETRLITLTGPGGTGKTRLALAVAAELQDDFEDGTFQVLLQAIREPDLLLTTIAQALDARQAGGQSLAGYLAPKELLLIMDNFEQIIHGASLLAELMAHAPRVKVIVTSREPLRIAGEHVFPVPPLALPDARRAAAPADIADCAAVRLFVQRAHSVQPGFALTPQNAAPIAELCMRLDGLPLAIELAAARASLLSPEAMVKRLGDRLKFLTGGSRDVPQRQQTLRNTLQWSHELLEPEEQVLFARLGVFAGGFTVEAAEAVCAAEIDVLAALVDRSMVRRNGERFDMLETIREFALLQLAASADGEALFDQHAVHFEALAERAYARRWHHEIESLDDLEREHDNLRAALDRLHRMNPRRLLRLAGALGWFWHMRSHYGEGRARLQQALAVVDGPDPWRARALGAAGELAAWSGDLAAARPLIDEAVTLWREQGQMQEIPSALIDLGWGCFYCGNPEARALMEEGMRLQLAIGDPLLVNRARTGLLQVLVGLGELELVEPMAREALAVAIATHDVRSEHLAHHFLADCSLIRGDCADALPRYRRALVLAVAMRDRAEIGAEIQGVAMAIAGTGHPARALQLAGAAAAEFEALGIDLSGMHFWMALLERYLSAARAALGDSAANAAWAEGRRAGFDYVLALALDAVVAG